MSRVITLEAPRSLPISHDQSGDLLVDDGSETSWYCEPVFGKRT
jgi:hypothetical protein